MPALDIDRETAHDAAARELAKPIYPRRSLNDLIAEWLDDLLHRLMLTGSSVPGGWLTVVALALLVLAAMIVAIRIARRTMSSRGDPPLYGDTVLTAAEHRARADQLAGQGDWTGAIRQRVRALGRQLEESGLLTPVPGRTAGELARDAGAAIPDIADDLASAATIFDDVAYGEQPGTEAGYRFVADLDDRLRQRLLDSAPGSVLR